MNIEIQVAAEIVGGAEFLLTTQNFAGYGISQLSLT
jgi:hypothetical protein